MTTEDEIKAETEQLKAELGPSLANLRMTDETFRAIVNAAISDEPREETSKRFDFTKLADGTTLVTVKHELIKFTDPQKNAIRYLADALHLATDLKINELLENSDDYEEDELDYLDEEQRAEIDFYRAMLVVAGVPTGKDS